MANTLTNIMTTVLARAIMTLRESCLLPQLVNTGYSLDAKQKGSTVDIPASVAQTVYNVSPSSTPKTPADTTPTKVSITLDKWKGTNFHLTDQERTRIMKEKNFLPGQTAEAMRALANQVNSDILSVYTGIYGYVGTAGTTPFSNSTDRTAAKDATKIVTMLDSQLCPKVGRSAVLDTTAVAEALALPQFSHAEKAGSSNVIDTANIGNKYGIGWFTENAIGSHTAGTITTGLIAKASTAQAVGLKDIVCTTAASTGACALLEGDIITFAGDDQTYVVTAAATQASAATDVTVSIEPGLKVAKAGSEAVTVKATHTVNLAFHKEAIALATAPFEKDVNPNPSVFMRDPVTGLVVRLEIVRQNKQTMWEFDMLYGMKLVRPEYAARLAG